MNKKTILITGASSGFGHETARKLLKTGEWTVYAAARNMEKMRDLEQKGAHLLKMDVTSDSDVARGVEQIIREQGRIDTLFANAGYGSYGTIENVPMDEIRYQYEVNVFGVARTVQAVLPHMRKQRSGRIVITSSLVSRLSTGVIGWYASTKHAILAVATALRQEVKKLGIKVVLIEPGVVKTGFDGIALNSLVQIEHPEDYTTLVRGMHRYISDSYKKCPGMSSTVKAMVKAITKKRPKPIYRTPLDSKLLPKLLAVSRTGFIDRMVLKMAHRAAKKE